MKIEKLTEEQKVPSFFKRLVRYLDSKEIEYQLNDYGLTAIVPKTMFKQRLLDLLIDTKRSYAMGMLGQDITLSVSTKRDPNAATRDIVASSKTSLKEEDMTVEEGENEHYFKETIQYLKDNGIQYKPEKFGLVFEIPSKDIDANLMRTIWKTKRAALFQVKGDMTTVAVSRLRQFSNGLRVIFQNKSKIKQALQEEEGVVERIFEEISGDEDLIDEFLYPRIPNSLNIDLKRGDSQDVLTFSGVNKKYPFAQVTFNNRVEDLKDYYKSGKVDIFEFCTDKKISNHASAKDVIRWSGKTNEKASLIYNGLCELLQLSIEAALNNYDKKDVDSKKILTREIQRGNRQTLFKDVRDICLAPEGKKYDKLLSTKISEIGKESESTKAASSTEGAEGGVEEGFEAPKVDTSNKDKTPQGNRLREYVMSVKEVADADNRYTVVFCDTEKEKEEFGLPCAGIALINFTPQRTVSTLLKDELTASFHRSHTLKRFKKWYKDTYHGKRVWIELFIDAKYARENNIKALKEEAEGYTYLGDLDIDGTLYKTINVGDEVFSKDKHGKVASIDGDEYTLENGETLYEEEIFKDIDFIDIKPIEVMGIVEVGEAEGIKLFMDENYRIYKKSE